MKVNCKGDVFENGETAVGSEERLVGNRKKEEDRLQYIQNYAKENQLQIIADGILSNGPGTWLRGGHGEMQCSTNLHYKTAQNFIFVQKVMSHGI
jgi:hypothetical protein